MFFNVMYIILGLALCVIGILLLIHAAPVFGIVMLLVGMFYVVLGINAETKGIH